MYVLHWTGSTLQFIANILSWVVFNPWFFKDLLLHGLIAPPFCAYICMHKTFTLYHTSGFYMQGSIFAKFCYIISSTKKKWKNQSIAKNVFMQLQLMLSESSIQKLAKNVVPILESKHKYLLQQGNKTSYVAIIAPHLPDHSIYVLTVLFIYTNAR